MLKSVTPVEEGESGVQGEEVCLLSEANKRIGPTEGRKVEDSLD